MFTFPAFADTAPEMSGMQRLAIGGYDTVAYLLSEKRSLVVLNTRPSGMTRVGNLPTRRTSISSLQIQRSTQLNMTGIVHWAWHTRMATKT